jgi:DNA-binding IscR family transcriptional regulator
MAPLPCVSISRYERCSQEPVCRFRRVLLEARNLTADLMEKATLDRVLKGSPVTAEEVFAESWSGGAGI